MFERYLIRGNQKLRYGYTTGTSAALACGAALSMLLRGEILRDYSLITPKGWEVEVSLEQVDLERDKVSCCVRKDGGDDIDATDGLLICAEARFSEEDVLCAGRGIGRVTKPGLSIEVGEAAINPVPRAMIAQEIKKVKAEHDYEGGIALKLWVPEGEKAAKKTFNERLGIQGGISIIGTTGIVEPKSNRALIETIRAEFSIQHAQGVKELAITPGNIGEAYLRSKGFEKPIIQCSNFIGEALLLAVEFGMEKILLAGHSGKMVKLAAGIMNTHSREADGRAEVLCAHAALQGVSLESLKAIKESMTTTAMLEILRREGTLEEVMQRVLQDAWVQVKRRLGDISLSLLIFEGEDSWLKEEA